ncbi:hypothetical protein SESBI_05799 [Sesbania bispinosa]|nr:hypothetical protein SESBI_05799 [Sesbania bispinosa]
MREGAENQGARLKRVRAGEEIVGGHCGSEEDDISATEMDWMGRLWEMKEGWRRRRKDLPVA